MYEFDFLGIEWETQFKRCRLDFVKEEFSFSNSIFEEGYVQSPDQKDLWQCVFTSNTIVNKNGAIGSAWMIPEIVTLPNDINHIK